MYDPSIGRWLEEDPIGFDAGDANLYRYVGNGPTNGMDPQGLASVTFQIYRVPPEAEPKGYKLTGPNNGISQTDLSPPPGVIIPDNAGLLTARLETSATDPIGTYRITVKLRITASTFDKRDSVSGTWYDYSGSPLLVIDSKKRKGETTKTIEVWNVGPSSRELVVYFVPRGVASYGKALVLGSVEVISIARVNRSNWKPITGPAMKK